MLQPRTDGRIELYSSYLAGQAGADVGYDATSDGDADGQRTQENDTQRKCRTRNLIAPVLWGSHQSHGMSHRHDESQRWLRLWLNRPTRDEQVHPHTSQVCMVEVEETEWPWSFLAARRTLAHRQWWKFVRLIAVDKMLEWCGCGFSYHNLMTNTRNTNSNEHL